MSITSLNRRLDRLERGQPGSGRDLTAVVKMTRADYAAAFEQVDETQRAALWRTYVKCFVPDSERLCFPLDHIRPDDRVYWRIHAFTEPVPESWSNCLLCPAAKPYGARVADVSGYYMHPAEVARLGDYWHFVDVNVWGEGEADIFGIPRRCVSWVIRRPPPGRAGRLCFPDPAHWRPATTPVRVFIHLADEAPEPEQHP